MQLVPFAVPRRRTAPFVQFTVPLTVASEFPTQSASEPSSNRHRWISVSESSSGREAAVSGTPSVKSPFPAVSIAPPSGVATRRSTFDWMMVLAFALLSILNVPPLNTNVSSPELPYAVVASYVPPGERISVPFDVALLAMQIPLAFVTVRRPPLAMDTVPVPSSATKKRFFPFPCTRCVNVPPCSRYSPTPPG